MSISEAIGPNGGELRLAGARVQLPVGALSSELVLTLRRGLAVPEGQEAVSEVFVIEPEGLILDVPAVVEVVVAGDDVALFTVDALGSKNLNAETREAGLEAELGTLGVIFGGKKNPCGQLLQDDANNCGSCGRSCNNNSGIVSCREGSCEIRCNNGHGDCDADADTGCEIDLRDDVDNCGGCGVVCSEDAICERQGNRSFCACIEGFAGDGINCEKLPDCLTGHRRVEEACVDIDECAEGLDSCGDSAICDNTVGAFSCSCPDGFEPLLGTSGYGDGDGGYGGGDGGGGYGGGDGGYGGGDGNGPKFECVDTDECAIGANNCSSDAACQNISGGFLCSCKPGFEGDGVDCLDIDECHLGTDSCATDAICTNTLGSFTCECKSGYVGDGSFCQEVDECAGNVAGCDEHATCENTPGAFICSCVAGYEGNGNTCLDVDECAQGIDTCDSNAQCINRDGGFDCTCEPGYEGDGQSCTDVDECATKVAQCSPDAHCENVSGSFACECDSGFRGNGFACDDVDECFEESDTCADDATCSNRSGGFDCECNAGFIGDGFACQDVDECQGDNLCAENASCENTAGGYQCQCNPGFSGNGETCDDIDECQEVGVCGAFGVCENVIGSFGCACELGFERVGELCVDIDECLTEECGEHGHCENSPGSFSCQCDEGFVGDGITCNDAAERVILVKAGGAHTCALFDNKMVRCWGWGIYGELGYGNTDDIGVTNEPADSPYVQLGVAARDLDLGVTHTCAILEDDTLRCWGRNFYGSLGLGNTNDIGDTELPNSSVLALGGKRVAQVAGGGEHTCALDFEGNVFCWGLGIDGQLGNGNVTPVGDDEDPLFSGSVNLLGSATQVVAGRDHSCALLEDGTVQCWGRGEHNPTGYGHTENIGDDELPVDAGAVDVGGTVLQLTAGWYHTCALLDDASVRCWGYGNLGALGYANRDSVGDDELPADVGTVDVGGPVKQVVAGTYHTCALLENGNVRCWGYGGDGQLGYGNTNTIGDNEHPFEAGDVDVGGRVTQLTAGSFHTCALLDRGTVRCWGSREHGQLCYQGSENVGDDERPARMGDCPILAAVCPGGFRLGEDGVTCMDVDECELGVDACSAQATCSNTEGRYECECHAGYEGDGFECEDVDECGDETDDCADFATCTNTDGGFSCACSEGYFGDGVSCGGACATSNDECDENAECTDGDGTYSCECLPGFVGDGFLCADIDECALDLDTCDVNAGCVNTPGAYECVCLETFVGTGETCACEDGYEDVGGACADINECSRGLDDCANDELCLNTDGGFECIGAGENPEDPEEPLVCPDGYVLTGASAPGVSQGTIDGFASVTMEQGANDAIATAQRIVGPTTVRGAADADSDAIDIYRVRLLAGQGASLFISADGVHNDLELHLHDLQGEPVQGSSGGAIRSLSTSRFESVVAEASGTYLVVVQASAGTSSYSLVIGEPLGASAALGNMAEPEFVPGEVIVRFDPRANMAHSIATVAQSMGTKQASGQNGGMTLMRRAAGRVATMATDPSSGLNIPNDAVAMAKTWSRRSDVLSASPNYLYKASAVPNDEHFERQWNYPAIRLPQAWDNVPDASAITVAVIDTGVILNHPDLDDVLVPGFDFIRDPSRARDGDGIDPDADDVGDSASPGASSYHGTHVAGTVSAETNNGIGVAGVAQGARIMPLRALGAGGGSSYDIMQSVRFAAGLPNDSGTVPDRRADVINMSLGGPGRDPAFEALIAEVRALGVVVVAAAGNSSSSVLAYPASYEGVISVSATDVENALSYYSNFGGAIDVAAPGGDVRVDLNGDGEGDGILSTLGADTSSGIAPIYKHYQGTSMASPHMAGVVALMRAANIELGPSDIDALLASGLITTDLGAAGRDDSFGHGLINAEAAVLRAQEFVAGAPPSEQPSLIAEPSAMSFLDPAETSQSLVVRNSGEGAIVIDAPTVDAPWLRFGAVEIIDDVHSYPVVIDRAGLEVGSYSATITVTSSANTASVPVVMEVAAPQCIDVDECELNLDDCANPEQNGDCRNLPGTFECFCFEGYEGDGKTCSDVDECEAGTDNCSDFAVCTNADPGFTCECLPGFEGDGIVCSPPNECELGFDNCDEDATCTDTFEGFECSCNDGYAGDGVECEDIDECEDGSHACDANAFCTNTIGAYECTCSPHFSGTGAGCIPDDGCLSLENFEADWPNATWREPHGLAVGGIVAASSARTGKVGLTQLDGSALHTPTALGESQDALGAWIRLGDVGAIASLVFGSSDEGGSFLQADGSGALGLYRWTRSGEPALINEVIAPLPIGEWLYLDVFFHGDGDVTASLFGPDGASTVAGLSGSVGELSTGNAGLESNGGADLDGVVACAFLPLVDECELGLDECDENATCNDLLGGYECVCNASFVGDGFTCEDENECETGNNSCSANAICTNTIGAYVCACAEGFEGDGLICTDVNECERGTFSCDDNATCVNTLGAYECACNAGYEGDGKTCSDIDECAIGTDTCADDAECINIPGSYDCSCLEGFEGNGFVCDDVDECALGLDSCHDAATCFNAEGSYTCECNGGWDGDGFECFDIDECGLGTDTCDPLAECSNSQGFFTCVCPDGFTGDGFSCIDVDECSAGLDNCDSNADCDNTAGEFTCTCKQGFQGNGFSCADVDECALGTDTCSDDAICLNTDGGFACECAPGFEGTGFVCNDIDECALGTDTCSERALCTNTIGAFACDCRQGFEGDGFTCLDVDECATGTFDCPLNSSCSNTAGGFDCNCRRGYDLDDAGVCVDIAIKAQSIGAGDAHTCALMNEGVVKCWGSGSNGRTGHGNTQNIGDDEIAGDAPIVNIAEEEVVQLAVGGAHNCVLLDDGTIRCWGLGQHGRLGHADSEDVGDDEVPADVGKVPMPASAVELALGQKHSCALLEGGVVSCWGDNSFGQLGAGLQADPIQRNDAVDVGGPVTAIAAGDYHTCALLDSGEVVCWGLGSFGRLGYGNSNAVGLLKTPADAGAVSLGASAIALAAGANHTCALLVGGELRCWGRALFGAIGTGVPGNVGDDEVPTAVAPVVLDAAPITVTAGSSHTCVAFADGEVQCFGLAAQGQLGYGNKLNIGDNEAPNLAGFVDVGGRVREIDAGAFHTCVVTDVSEVRCWGNGSLGQLGYGTTFNVGDTESPADVDVVRLAP